MNTQITPRILTRFWSKVEKTNNCWVWKGYKTNDDYGRFMINGKIIYAHRFAYELLRGNIPQGLILDHLCRNPACVNPSHLEIVTHKQNILRGVGLCAQNAKKTHCPQGHEYNEENTYRKDGGRWCKLCKSGRQRINRSNNREFYNEQQREWRKKQKQA